MRWRSHWTATSSTCCKTSRCSSTSSKAAIWPPVPLTRGRFDENGGGSFSEYVAILSGNDDLLEKAKLDKKLAVLESERQAFHRNKGNAKGKLNERTSGIEKNNAFIGRFTRDWEYFNKVAPADAKTGLRPNPLKLDGVDSDNVEILATGLPQSTGMPGRRMTI